MVLVSKGLAVATLLICLFFRTASLGAQKTLANKESNRFSFWYTSFSSRNALLVLLVHVNQVSYSFYSGKRTDHAVPPFFCLGPFAVLFLGFKHFQFF